MARVGLIGLAAVLAASAAYPVTGGAQRQRQHVGPVVALDRLPAAARRVIAPDAPGPRRVTVAVHVHVIHAGGGNVPDETIDRQIAVLTSAFGSHGFTFARAAVDRTANKTWMAMGSRSAAEADAKTALRRGGASTLNLYLAQPGGGLLEFATFPWEYAARPSLDGVVAHVDSLPGGDAAPYNLGKSAVHAVGHWLGLFDTHEGGCREPGDFVEDTPAAHAPTYGCPASADSCSGRGADPLHNFMSFTDDACMKEFTPGQGARMREMWRTYRAGR